jgi:hypothetical protein
MNPTHDDAPILAGTRGAGNVLQLRSYPKHNIRRSSLQAIVAPRRVRLFLGNNAVVKAIEWTALHGQGTAIALPEGRDPVDVEWPMGALVKVVAEQPESQLRLSALAFAMRRAGVVYAALPHLPDWPNLWLAAAATEMRT